MLICCSRGRAEDFTTSSCFSLSEIHKEKVSNADPNWSQWSFISSRVLMLKKKNVKHEVKVTLTILHVTLIILTESVVDWFRLCRFTALHPWKGLSNTLLYCWSWNPSHSLLSPASTFSTCSLSERACCNSRFLFFGPSWISVALFSKVFMCDTCASHCFNNTYLGKKQNKKKTPLISSIIKIYF